jgi:Cof subfamily protein (haloacid dehalogenase superfamily)
MLAVDLDSTLIGKDHKVNSTDAQALKTAMAAGMRVALCTGRNVMESAGVIAALQLKGNGVFANGATIADMGEGVHLTSTCMSREITEDVVDFFGAKGHAVLALVDHPETRRPHYVITDHGPPHRATVEWLLANKMHAEDDDVTGGKYAAHVVRMGIVVDVPDARAIEDAMTRRFGTRLMHHSIYSKLHDCQVIETFAPNVNKWTGILEICRREGLDPKRVVTIGDDTNDIAMLENAELSFAVANAPPAIRARAKRITATQEQCGVARAIEVVLGEMK